MCRAVAACCIADSGIRTHSISVTQLSDVYRDLICTQRKSSLKTELTNGRRVWIEKYRVFVRVMAVFLVHTTVHVVVAEGFTDFFFQKPSLKILGARMVGMKQVEY